jgi:UDP-N-acetylmuramoyl-tripeptide--D-alanyl-D-alanine ligase
MGQKRDGHNFILDGFQNGATAALVRSGHHLVGEVLRVLKDSRGYVSADSARDVTVIEVRHTLVALQKLASWFRRQFDQLDVVGITGSVGKTQTKEMLLQIMSPFCNAVGTDKNFNNEIGVPITLSKLRPDTECAVVEMAMRGRGEISLLSRIAQPTLCLVTNTLGSHIGRLGSGAEVARAKAEIVDGMKAGNTLWLNLHDHNLATLLHEIRDKQAIERGLNIEYFDVSAAAKAAPQLPPLLIPGDDEIDTGTPPSDVKPSLWLDDVVYRGIEGSSFVFCTSEGCAPVKLRAPGRGAIEDFASAAVLAHSLGVEYADIAESAKGIEPTPQRLVPYELKPGATLIDDTYNSSPASTQDAIEILATFPRTTRLVVILGDMLELGKFETLLHRQISKQVYQLPPSLVIGIGPRMSALREVPVPEGFELTWFHGISEEDEKIAQGFPPARPQDHSANHGEMVDDLTIDRVTERIFRELDGNENETVILVKGSRALHLERVVDRMLSYFGKEEQIL